MCDQERNVQDGKSLPAVAMAGNSACPFLQGCLTRSLQAGIHLPAAQRARVAELAAANGHFAAAFNAALVR